MPGTDDTAAGGLGLSDLTALVAEQERLGGLDPPSWTPPERFTVAGCFVAFERGAEGPGHRGDPAWIGATLVGPAGAATSRVVRGRAGARYEPGLLMAREGAMLLAAVEALPERPDVLLVDGTGRDHPRRAGVAVHLGSLLDLPTVGVTHRPLVADRTPPALARRGDSAVLRIDDDAVAAWVCTGDGLRPLVAHAGWRTGVGTAIEVVVGTATTARTPEPLRLAREAARRARAGLGLPT